jgi:hypothetical protein
MSVATRFVLSLTACGVLVGGAWVAPGCQPAETAGPAGQDGGTIVLSADGGVSYCGEGGVFCCAGPGQSPRPNCDDGNEHQCASSTACKIDTDPFDGGPNGCGSTAKTSCEPLATNPASGGVQNFRMRRLIIVAPAKLANPTVQNVVINSGVDMKEPQCGETQSGEFSWLLSFDRDAGTLTTGGAPPCDLPSCDPYTQGYCFMNQELTQPNGQSIQIAPVTVKTVTADGTLQTAPIPELNIPIFFQGSIITLPIMGGSVQGVSITDNGNCIGTVNIDALGADCTDDYQSCSKWLTAGALTGFITLDAANQVQVQTLGVTLCSLLTGDTDGPAQTSPGGPIKSCAVNAAGLVTAKGNYCSKGDAGVPVPGQCEDSYWLAATFAASAVTINDGTGTAYCQGGGTTPEDAGNSNDSGSADAGGDASDAGPGDAAAD